MASHEYTADQALTLLMKKVRERDVGLAERIQRAINSGKDIQQSDPGTRRKRARSYRRSVPYSYEEALEVALDALTAWFVEQPTFINSLSANISHTTIGGVKTSHSVSQSVDPVDSGVNKSFEFEIQTETQITKDGAQTLSVPRVRDVEIEDQALHIEIVRQLTDFKG